MRRGVVLFLVSTVFILGFAVHSVWTLLGLLVFDGHEDAISRAELPAPNSDAISERPQLIPKIIHQTYVNESIPDHWKQPQQTCLDLHPDYEYKVRGVVTRRSDVAEGND
jgi:mannosyltransferase OCH1-like enzyme